MIARIKAPDFRLQAPSLGLRASGDRLQASIATLEPGAWSLTPPHASEVRGRAAGFPGAVSHRNPGVWRLKPGASPRRGISLLEVLVAVFVLTLGLMGIAMVIPAGRSLMVEAAKSDRGSACGRAALNDVQIRRWDRPDLWKQKWGSHGYKSAVINSSEYSPAPSRRGLIYGETFFLDPYFTLYDTNDTTATIRHFPYAPYPTREFGTVDRQWPERALARRVGFSIPEVVAERLTTWADELIFSLEADNARPRQSYTCSDGLNWSVPPLPGDESAIVTSGAYPLQPSSEGRFTWAAMITPIVPASNQGTWDHDGDGNATTPGIPLVYPATISQYEISIVVFYNRTKHCLTATEIQDATDTEAVRERSVYARLDGGGVGGGDVLLFTPGNGTGTTSVPANPPADFLNVRKNQWVMLKALDRSRPVFTTAISGAQMETRPTVCKWYRIVGVDDEFTIDSAFVPAFVDPSSEPVTGGNTLTGRGRYVTLAGPDWAVDTTFSAPVGPDPANYPRFRPDSDIAEAALVDDVVGVYTTIIDVNAL